MNYLNNVFYLNNMDCTTQQMDLLIFQKRKKGVIMKIKNNKTDAT